MNCHKSHAVVAHKGYFSMYFYTVSKAKLPLNKEYGFIMNCHFLCTLSLVCLTTNVNGMLNNVFATKIFNKSERLGHEIDRYSFISGRNCSKMMNFRRFS